MSGCVRVLHTYGKQSTDSEGCWVNRRYGVMSARETLLENTKLQVALALVIVNQEENNKEEEEEKL